MPSRTTSNSPWKAPAAVMLITLGCLAAAPSVPTPTSPASDYPTPTRLITRCFHAMGGPSAIQAVQSMAINATVNLEPDSTPLARMSMAFDRAGRSLVRFNFLETNVDGQAETSFGSNGDTAWEQIHPAEGGGWQLLDEEDLAERIAANNWLGRLLRLGNEVEQMRTVGPEEFNGSPCWNIAFPSPQGPMNVFFDTQSKLLKGFRRTFQSPPLDDGMSAPPQQLDIYFSHWKDVGELRLFHRVELVQRDIRMNITYDSLTLNDVPETTFDLPPQVQALVPAAKEPTDPPAQEPPNDQ